MAETTSSYRAPSVDDAIKYPMSFWTLVLLIATTLVTITVVIVTRPDEQKVQQMIDLNLRSTHVSLEQIEGKVDGQSQRLDRIEGKIDKLNERGSR